MGIRKVEAEIVCDGCGGLFTVELDPAYNTGDGASIHDYVGDVIDGLPWCSIQGGHWLCRECTGKVDAAFEDDEDPTYDQVAAVLDTAAGEE